MKIDTLSPSSIHLMKIDVQGFELRVLKSAASLIHKFHPFIIIEFEDIKMNLLGYDTVDIVKYIRNTLDYEIFLSPFITHRITC